MWVWLERAAQDSGLINIHDKNTRLINDYSMIIL